MGYTSMLDILLAVHATKISLDSNIGEFFNFLPRELSFRTHVHYFVDRDVSYALEVWECSSAPTI